MADKTDTRALALDIIIDVCDGGEYLGGLLSQSLDRHSVFEKRDRAFISRLCIGTVERLITIDHVIDNYAKPPVRKQKPVIRGILRMSVYQILYMDSVPDHAVCNEAVRLARKRRFAGLSGFVNGVLRKIVREKEAGALEQLIDSSLSVSLSVPEWVFNEYENVLGKEKAIAALSSMYERGGEITLSANTVLIDPEELWSRIEEVGVKVERSPLSHVVFIKGVDRVDTLPGYEEGLFFVQDLSSAETIAGAGISEGDHILDLCAAPGGKSMAACMKAAGSGGYVVSCDVSEKKVDLIRENASRMKMSDIRPEVNDAAVLRPEWKESFDLVICDLPCSGLGTFAKKPELKYRVKPEDIRSLAGIQKEILAVAQTYVRPGGKLLFSTCTISREENQNNRAWFQKEFEGFDLMEEKLTAPDRHHDGFYRALFVRK